MEVVLEKAINGKVSKELASVSENEGKIEIESNQEMITSLWFYNFSLVLRGTKAIKHKCSSA